MTGYSPVLLHFTSQQDQKPSLLSFLISADPYFAEIIRGIEDAVENDYLVLLGDSGPARRNVSLRLLTSSSPNKRTACYYWATDHPFDVQ
ncbi:hypothetical protein OK016_07690 [Vibrio chagasii]|nr:hypothetical protein [Vibrio chagasii]